MTAKLDPGHIKNVLDEAIELSLANNDGKVAGYIPELEQMPPELTNVSVMLNDGQSITSGEDSDTIFTLQSVSKLVILIGMLEEHGMQKVYSWVRTEPSGDDFASIARLDQFGPIPSNPMLNSGAISLSARVEGAAEDRLHWLEKWMERCFGEPLTINQKVFASEARTGDRNRSLAYLLKSNNVITKDVDEVLETYFYLCSFQLNVKTAAYLPMLLANGGRAPDGTQVISKETVQFVICIMITCGLYNESGVHLVRTGLPGKSGVSGLIIAAAKGHGGIAVMSPRVNRKGTSIRGEIILESVSRSLDWHFAA